VTSRPGPSRPASSFAQLVQASTVPFSRRDLLRSSAVIGAASVLGARPVLASPLPSATSRALLQDEEPTTDVILHLPFNSYGQPVTVDPHLTVNWGPFWVMLPYPWSGLLRFDENGAVEPDLAESVTPNEDGSVWTATLREGVAFANGDPILAEHVVASWRRALDVTRLAPMARFMAPVSGFDAYVAGDSQQIGFQALDERSIEITLDEPLSHFPAYLATFVWAVMHPGYIRPGEEEEISLADASAGAWRIEEFDDTSRIVMTPNEHYWEPTSPSITGITWHIAPGAGTDQAILDMYLADEIAIADVPASLYEAAGADDTIAPEIVTIEDHASTLAISLDFRQPPFDDVRVRRAIAHAIDKERWADEIENGAYVPATSFTPPVLSEIAGYDAPAGIDHAPDRVAGLLSDAGVDPDTTEQEIIHFQPATDSVEAIDRRARLLELMSEATGVAVTHDTNLTREQITALRQDDGGLQFDIVQWWIDSDTPSILAIAAQDSEFNAGWFNWEAGLGDTGEFTPGEDAATFNERIEDAFSTVDEDSRNSLYREAEELLLRNAVLIPLGYWVQRYVQKPWLHGTRQGPWSGSTPVRIDENVVVLGDPTTPAD
jgi:ABC-type transport system substrate-binding protein